MLPVGLYFMLSWGFSLLLLMVIMVLSDYYTLARSKVTPFECGFDPKESARLPFSVRFFLLAVVFLVFDIEIVLLFPLILGLNLSVYLWVFIAGLGFLCILILGLLHEWKEGALSWVV